MERTIEELREEIILVIEEFYKNDLHYSLIEILGLLESLKMNYILNCIDTRAFVDVLKTNQERLDNERLSR